MRKKISVLLRAYKIANNLVPGYMPLNAVRSVFMAFSPFISIIASAMVVNALSEGYGFERVLKVIIGAALLNFAVRCVEEVMKRISVYLSENFWCINEQPLDEKQREMDFERIEDPETRVIRQKLRTFRRTTGNGILPLFLRFELVLTNFFTVLISIGVFAPMFKSASTKLGGFWDFINTPWFAALFILLIIGNAVLGMYFTSTSSKKAYEALKGIHFVNMLGAYFNEKLFYKYQMGKDTKMYKLGNSITAMHEKVFVTYNSVIKMWQSINVRYQCYNDIVANILSAIVYIFVAVKALLGGIGIGGVVQYVGGITRFNTGLKGLANEIAALFANVEALNVFFEFLDMPQKIYHGTIPVEKRRDNEYEIEFHNVSFKYPGADSYALKNINLKFQIGQRCAVVGMNGSGKSTMIKLLCRLYDPTDGMITLNGIDIKKYDYTDYMSIFSVVFQDFSLFSFPLGQNVAASAEYDRDRVIECLTKAGLKERMESLPKGLDTPLYKDFDENGVEISGGEAQK